MTSKLKYDVYCPFCGEELEDAGIHSAGFYFGCTNCYMKQKEKNDNYTASPRIWQALIQAKQDLEIATKAMNQVMSMGAKNNICYHLKAKTVKSILGNALEQIEHKDEK